MIVEVAAAVILRADGAFLLAQRPEGKVYAGWWEFPGGKVEQDERTDAALRREIQEELGIDVRTAYPWIVREFAYAHATVRLHFYRVTAWEGEPHPRERQAIAWQRIDAPMQEPMLPANAPVLAALSLPPEYAFTTEATTLEQVEGAMRRGIRLIRLRDAGEERDAFAAGAAALARRHGARVLVSGERHARDSGRFDGLHLTARELAALRERPDTPLFGASCHRREELERAAALGADFAVLGPVQPTDTHPGGAVLGWEGFREIAAGLAIPVYAIGGLRREDMTRAWSAGAHGVAMIRGAWA